MKERAKTWVPLVEEFAIAPNAYSTHFITKMVFLATMGQHFRRPIEQSSMT